MIRRWSCLIDLNNNFSGYNDFLKTHKISVFKSSVNFKRFTFKYTKFKRKSLIRLKHRSNWLIYTNVLKLWIKDYLFNKNYLRYQYFNKIFINNSLFYNFNFIKNRSDLFFYNFNFLFSVFTNKNYSYFYKNNLINFKNSPITVAWYLSTPSWNMSTLPIYNSWENIQYSQAQLKDTIFNIDDCFEILFSLILQKNIEIKKILIVLFYINLVNFKNVK